MGTAPTERGEKTRKLILKAAADLYHRQGVNATSVDEVLDACGAGKSQFYHYFKSKDDLLIQIAREELRPSIDELPFLQDLASWKGIQAWFDGVVEWQKEVGCVGG